MPLYAPINQWIEQYPEFVRPAMHTSWAQIENHYSSESILPPIATWTSTFCPWPDGFVRSLLDIFSRSDFVAKSCTRFPHYLDAWSSPESELYQDKSIEQLQQELDTLCLNLADEAALMRVLRLFRREQMVRIIWRDLLKWAPLEQTLIEVSNLADVCIQVSLAWLYKDLVSTHGLPTHKVEESDNTKADVEESLPQAMVVLGMGKLGAHELNVSSDIDLIFAYPDNGMTDHPTKPIDNHKFFTRLGQRLIHTLDTITADGFVFRVDMRLRPYGSAGALALNYSAFEEYYQNQGREWERFAMIKARAITGSAGDHERLRQIIKPFVYRRYADFSSFQALRDMKRLISSEVHRKGGEKNIKLGAGGIREIEFIAQACQLIYGGRDTDLQQTGLLPVLEHLKQNETLPVAWLDDLLAANRYLRCMEHAIQGLADKQTQLIPDNSADRERVSWSLEHDNWAAANEELVVHRNKVSRIFDDFLQESASDKLVTQEATTLWLHLWQAQATEQDWLSAFSNAGYTQPEECYRKLMEIPQSRFFSSMSAASHQRFEQFIPLLLSVVAAGPKPDVTLIRVLEFVKAILGRTIYLVLLYENPAALTLLCQLCSDSPWIAEHIAKSPVILDELLDRDSLYQVPSKSSLKDELRQHLLRIPEDDLEAQMDGLRNFRQSHMLRVAAAELSKKLPLMKVSDYLTWLAECLIEQSVNIAWKNLVDRHGLPSGIERSAAGSGFAVVGYGKLGGIEMGYNSDLDMVFVYDADDNGMTQGERAINNQVFYTRLGQRIIHILSTNTTQGALYEVDMRLRPSGNSGMLVSSLAAFQKYQLKDAWTWEHQALVRARALVGDTDLLDAFERVRALVLSAARDEHKLRSEVLAMREKMQRAEVEALKNEQQAHDDIKLGLGGLVDIEFITQYGVLLKAPSEPSLLEWSDNVRLLEALSEAGCFGELDFQPLIDAYRTLRSARHRKSLADDCYQVSLADFPELRTCVRKSWGQVFA